MEYLVNGESYSESGRQKIPPKALDLARKIADLEEGQQRIIEGTVKEFLRTASKPEALYTGEPAPAYTADDTADVIELPYYGKVAAGDPLEINIDPGEYVHFPRRGLRGNPRDYFALTVWGYSMIEAGISKGDLVVIRKAEEPIYGKIMLVLYENASTLKKIVHRGGKTYLCWDDGTGTEQEINSSEYRIQGVLVAAIKQYGNREFV